MERTTIEILQAASPSGAPKYWVRQTQPPFMAGLTISPCSLPTSNLIGAGAVRIHGQSLADELGRAHQAIQSRLQVIQNHRADEHCIEFLLSLPSDEDFNWETLYVNGEFLALLPFPAASVVRVPAITPQHRVQSLPYAGEFRILAFLSAHERPAKEQWEKLANSTRTAVGAGLPVKLFVYVGEYDLRDAIKNQMATDKFIDDVAFIPPDINAFRDRIKEVAPHVLHFYCHGKAQSGSAELQLASLDDWLNIDNPNYQNTPLRLSTTDFPFNARDPASWLVVLNCCEGANSDGAGSFAFDLVTRNGFSHVIAMLEPVSVSDANTCCERLYPAVFEQVLDNAHQAQRNRISSIDFSLVLAPVRDALCNAVPTPADQYNWAIPAQYKQQGPLEFPVIDPRDVLDAKQSAEELSVIIAFLHENGDCPAAVKSAIINGAEIPTALRDELLAIYVTH